MVEGSQTATFVEYPDSDGQPMTESDATRIYLIYCVEALRLFFRGRSQVYVSGNLFIYYQEGQPNKSVSPDVFVVFGVSNRKRRSYKAWQEGGKLPSFILEITSLSTKKQDEESKPLLYASLGVPEYFQYDPTGDYLKPQIKGKRLVNGSYEPIPPVTLTDGTVVLHSETLGLDLRLLPADQTTVQFPGIATRELRLFDPQTGAKLLNHEETEYARVEAEYARTEAEQMANEERQRAEQAEQRLTALMEKLRAQGIDLETE